MCMEAGTSRMFSRRLERTVVLVKEFANAHSQKIVGRQGGVSGIGGKGGLTWNRAPCPSQANIKYSGIH